MLLMTFETRRSIHEFFFGIPNGLFHFEKFLFSGVGTGGSNFDGKTQTYPDFTAQNFHQPPCPVDVSYFTRVF